MREIHLLSKWTLHTAACHPIQLDEAWTSERRQWLGHVFFFFYPTKKLRETQVWKIKDYYYIWQWCSKLQLPLQSLEQYRIQATELSDQLVAARSTAQMVPKLQADLQSAAATCDSNLLASQAVADEAVQNAERFAREAAELQTAASTCDLELKASQANTAEAERKAERFAREAAELQTTASTCDSELKTLQAVSAEAERRSL